MKWEHDRTEGFGKSQGPEGRLRDDPRSVALKLLAIRQRSVGGMRQRLREKGFSPTDVARVVAECIAQGLLDDLRFAEDLVAYALARHPVGRRLLLTKLCQHSVPAEIADVVLVRLLPPEREADLARSAAKRKLAELRRRGQRPQSAEAVSRVVRFLLARGFASGVISAVLDELKSGVHYVEEEQLTK